MLRIFKQRWNRNAPCPSRQPHWKCSQLPPITNPSPSGSLPMYEALTAVRWSTRWWNGAARRGRTAGLARQAHCLSHHARIPAVFRAVLAGRPAAAAGNPRSRTDRLSLAQKGACPMTGWLIAGGILLLLAGLLFTPAVLHLTLQDNAPPVIRLSFLGIPLYRSDRKQSTAKRSAKHKRNEPKTNIFFQEKETETDRGRTPQSFRMVRLTARCSFEYPEGASPPHQTHSFPTRFYLYWRWQLGCGRMCGRIRQVEYRSLSLSGSAGNGLFRCL